MIEVTFESRSLLNLRTFIYQTNQKFKSSKISKERYDRIGLEIGPMVHYKLISLAM